MHQYLPNCYVTQLFTQFVATISLSYYRTKSNQQLTSAIKQLINN